jgi:hypothetical protein
MDVTKMDIWLLGRGKEKSITTCTAEQKKRKTERTWKSNLNGHVVKQ